MAATPPPPPWLPVEAWAVCLRWAALSLNGEEASCGSPAVRSAANGSDNNLFIFFILSFNEHYTMARLVGRN